MFFLADRMIHDPVLFQKAGTLDTVYTVFIAYRVYGLFPERSSGGIVLFQTDSSDENPFHQYGWSEGQSAGLDVKSQNSFRSWHAFW